MFDFITNDTLPSSVDFSPTHQFLDASKVTKFMECPRSFFYEYVLGWRSERPNNHLVFGVAWHEALEQLLTYGHTAENVLKGYDKFLAKYREKFPNGENDELFFPKTPERALDALVEYAKTYKNDDVKYEVLYTEIAFTAYISENYYLIGRMDSIVRHLASNLIRSIEHKTASSLRYWDTKWDLSMQAHTYMHAMNCLYGFDLVDSIHFSATAFLKNKGTRGGKMFDFERAIVKRSKDQMRTWLVMANYWVETIEREFELLCESDENQPVLSAFPMNPTNCDKWAGCKWRDFCNAWSNPLQKCFQPPLGFLVEHWNPHEEEANVTMELGEGREAKIEETVHS